VGGAFAVNPKWQGRVKGLRLILIDDVFTTGATSDGCVSVLKRNGASWVQIFVGRVLCVALPNGPLRYCATLDLGTVAHHL
jgi:orotate phosphoribosyltransferase-like protein